MKLFWILVVTAVINGCMYVSGSAEGESSMHATAIDVGQGLAVLLEYGGRYAMYDFGPDSVGVVDSLLARGVDTLSYSARRLRLLSEGVCLRLSGEEPA